MKLIKSLFVVVLFAMSSANFAKADAETIKEVEKLLDIMNMEILLQESIELSLNSQIQANPAIAPFKEVMFKFFEKHMSFESLKPDFIQLYAEVFTAAELKEINAFYSTPTGQKTVVTMPDLMNKGAQLGARKVQENMAELESMIAEEAARIEEREAE